jgi:phosphoenolpyruvate carboxylase
VRVLRKRERESRLRESIDEALATLKANGLTTDDVQGILNRLRLRLVLTAHPSEAKRKEVLIKLRHITQMMNLRERSQLLPHELQAVEDRLAEEIEELWQTRLIRARQTTVADEVDFGLYFVTSVIMNVAIEIYDLLGESLERHFPDGDWSVLPIFLRYASWIGGDRDGNPNVTTDVTLETLQTLRNTAHDVYLREIAHLREHLTQGINDAGISEALQAAIIAEEKSDEAMRKYPAEPYRQFTDIIYDKLSNNRYLTGKELLADLQLIEASLRQNRGKRTASGVVKTLVRKVKLFGLHILPLEIREDATLHAAAIDELFRAYRITDNYLDLPDDEKQRLLTAEIQNPRPLFPGEIHSLSEASQGIIATWRMIREAHQAYGTECIDTVIASMSKQPSDVLTMLLFATEVGIQDHVQIVPLFETIDDLDNAPGVMTTLFNNDVYAHHLKKRADGDTLRQQIMIGYSDSSKDGGYIASNWYLYQAQQKLTETCTVQNISLELFHGRGGSIGRGGGPTNRAIRSQPPQSLSGGIKMTEQGEVIAYRYSNEDIARRHLQQVIHAGLIALSATQPHDIRDEWQRAMEQLSEYGKDAYRNFVYETDGFLDYWQSTTPINELGQLKISSRPAKRGSKGGFAAMRAIPWVFSWMQSRAIIPSWYGIGYAFNKYTDSDDSNMDVLRDMYQNWAFFSALVDNAQLDVAKADMGIVAIYSTLVKDITLRNTMYQRINDEHHLTTRMICQVTGQDELLENMSAIKTSIDRRNPYVDPLNFIQVELLRNIREMEPDDPQYAPIMNAILATINGIAAGMKTTG